MTEILLYGIIGDSWDGLDAKSILAQIQATDDDIVLRINSPGGYVMEGLAVYNVLKGVRDSGRKVTVKIDALAASMASVIAMVGEEITMSDNALMMIHNPWDCACGDATELRRKAEQLDLIRDNLIKIYSAKTGIDAAALKPMLEAETWLTAEQAMEQGFITAIDSAVTAVAVGCDIQKFGFRNAPNHPAVQGIVWDRAAAAAFFNPKGVINMTDKTPPVAAPVATPVAIVAPPTLTQADVDAASALATAQATMAELERGTQIRAMCTQHKMDDSFMSKLITDKASLPEARALILDKLAESSDAMNIGGNSSIVVGADERSKWLQGAEQAILIRSGLKGSVESYEKSKGNTQGLNAGEFRGATLFDLARNSLERSGVKMQSLDRDEIVKQAMMGGARGALTQSTSDFTVLLENIMHKAILAEYAIIPDTWSRFCAIGSVSDFRPHNRYRTGSFGVLKPLNEAGQFETVSIPDGAKVSISADDKGYMVNLTRKMIVNDDLGVFNSIAKGLGRAAKMTIEVDVYAMLALNGGNGPTFGANPFFHAANGNLITPSTAMSAASLSEMGAKMAEQKDISGNDFVDLRLDVLLAPYRIAQDAKVINAAEFDTTDGSAHRKPNKVRGLFRDIVETPRLTGTRIYGFANPAISPAFEVAFLNGQMEPQIESKDGWNSLGVEWRIFHEYGVAPIDPKAAQTNAGA